MSKQKHNQDNIILPAHFEKYFWDCNFNELNMHDYSFFISERILVYGNLESLKWLLKTIEKEYLKNVVNKSKNLDKKTRNYWITILE
ncbi:DUF6922 domain-containing protein [Calditrichota bacterium]